MSEWHDRILDRLAREKDERDAYEVLREWQARSEAFERAARLLQIELTNTSLKLEAALVELLRLREEIAGRVEVEG